MQTITGPGKRLAALIGEQLPAARLSAACAAISVLLLGGCQLADMAQFTYANATATEHWVDEARSTTLPFVMIDDHIVVPVRVNGSEPLNFVLDSGAAANLILESRASDALSLQLGAELNVSGVGTGTGPVARIVKDTRLSVGGVQLDGLSVIYLPLNSVPFFDNLDEVYFDGVIGAPFFDRFVIEINYDRQLISFSEPESALADIERRTASWEELPLQIQSGVPYLHTQVSTDSAHTVAVKLLVDTGYRGPVSLTPDTSGHIDEPSQYFSTLSQGISGDVATKVGMSESVNVGDFQLSDVPVHYSITGGESDHESNGLLGNEVLRRFNLVFDYPHKRMLVVPNQSFAEPIAADRSGLLLRPHRLGAVVKSVASNSAGQHTGLAVGDIITSIDAQQVSDTNITALKSILASQRATVPVCWLSVEQSQCGSLALASRFDRAKP